jgi:predicted amidohydrolase
VTAAAQRCDAALEYLVRATRELGTDLAVVTTIVRDTVKGIRHTAVLVSGGKLVGYQDQLHPCARHPWATPDHRVKTVDLPWGRVALIVGDDALYPETFRLAALAGAQVAAASFHAQEAWELQNGLLERAAENRLCLVAATRPTPVGTSIITTLHKDFTLATPWTERSFDGELSSPLVRRSTRSGLLIAPIHPAHANNKLLATATDLLRDRPWALSAALASPHDIGT